MCADECWMHVSQCVYLGACVWMCVDVYEWMCVCLDM